MKKTLCEGKLRVVATIVEGRLEGVTLAGKAPDSISPRDLNSLRRRLAHLAPVRIQGTPFQRDVWSALQRIPAGRVMTYGGIAAAIGRPRAARAVGNACRVNPWPILVPCHRAVASEGLGGFVAGSAWKRALLEAEGAIGALGKQRFNAAAGSAPDKTRRRVPSR